MGPETAHDHYKDLAAAARKALAQEEVCGMWLAFNDIGPRLYCRQPKGHAGSHSPEVQA